MYGPLANCCVAILLLSISFQEGTAASKDTSVVPNQLYWPSVELDDPGVRVQRAPEFRGTADPTDIA